MGGRSVFPGRSGPRGASPEEVSHAPSRLLARAAAVSACILVLSSTPQAQTDDPGPPNVTWSLGDSVSACPAGDSVFSGHSTHKHPSRLRITVRYTDANEEAKVGVPPESIWVTYTTTSGNVYVNDKAPKVYADDSTNATGRTRITIPSLSGGGTLQLTLMVSGVSQGSKSAQVRSTDVDADIERRTSASDSTTGCDIDWSGSTTQADRDTIGKHLDHWKRNALHGTLVKRTSYCETCSSDEPNSKGESQIFWSPSQRYIAHTAFVHASPAPGCKVFVVTSDPKEPYARTQLTFVPAAEHDYDPSWSPLNTEIVFDRGDSLIIRKGLPWTPDTSEVLVTTSSNCGPHQGDNVPAVSPDGQWIVFSRCNSFPPGGWNLWRIRINGAQLKRLTAGVTTDFYASWAPDGQTIYFQRKDPNLGPQLILCKVPADSGAVAVVFSQPVASPDTFDAVQPALSPDGQILVAGYGKRDRLVRNVVTHTLDPALPSPTARKLVANYRDTTFAEKSDFPILSPRLSPDGTRLALGSKQVWAVRRNMNDPPRISSVTWLLSQPIITSIHDTIGVYGADVQVGLSNCFVTHATDAEGDSIWWYADILDPNMSFDPSLHRLCFTAPAVGYYYARIRVSGRSGGSDALIFKFHAYNALGSSASRPADQSEPAGESVVTTPNPMTTEFRIEVPTEATGTVRLRVFDVSGRECASVRGSAGKIIMWRGTDRGGSPVAPGIYLYRLENDHVLRRGRIVLIR